MTKEGLINSLFARGKVKALYAAWKEIKEEIVASDLTSQVVEGKIHMYEAIDQP